MSDAIEVLKSEMDFLKNGKTIIFHKFDRHEIIKVGETLLALEERNKDFHRIEYLEEQLDQLQNEKIDNRKQGALEELRNDLKMLNKNYKDLTKSTIKDYSIFIEGKLDYINTLILEKKKRIKDLEEGVEK